MSKDNINDPIVTSHRYRNSRLGDSLKELELTEGRCTGFPKIRQALQNNGSPPPVFETDNDRDYFMTTFKINPRVQEMAAKITPAGGGKVVEICSEKSTQKSDQKILGLIAQNNPITRAEIAQAVGLSEGGVKKQLRQLQAKGVLKRIGPDKGGHWEVLKAG